MFKNNLRVAYRNLLKNRVFSYINVLGLAIGIAAFLFIVQYVRFERSYEDFHVNADNTYRLLAEFYKGSEYVMTDCETYAPLGPLLKEKMPEVVDFVRLYGIDGQINVRAGALNFLESGLYWADHSVFNVFTHTFVNGDPAKALIAPFEVVLTESMAKKYFGHTNIIDESIEIENNTFRIKAVIADVPANTHLKFSFLLSRLSFKTVKPWYPDDKWNNNNEYTYVLTLPGTDLGAFNAKLKLLSETELKSVLPEERIIAEPIKDIHLYSDNPYDPEPGGNAQSVYYLTLIALFVLAIAWVNYINLSTARAVERAREVGIRKVMGSVKLQLVLQFLTESFIINFIAGILALFLFQVTFPFFRDLSGQPLPLNLMDDQWFWILLSGLIGIGSLLSGLYPAFVLASFNPAAVLKGKFQSSSHGQLLRKGLVIFQFSATVVLIIAMCTVYLQVQFLRKQNLGMNIDQTIVLTGKQLNRQDSIFRQTSEAFKSELMKDPSIRTVARSEAVPGLLQELSTTSIQRLGNTEGDRGYLYYFFRIDADYIQALNMSLIAGRNFKDGLPNQDQIIVNEEAAKMLGFSRAEEAVGSNVTFNTRGDGKGSTIIGVLKNFYYRSPKEGHLPMFFYYGEPADYFTIQVKSEDMSRTIKSVATAWSKIYPNTVFDYYFLDEKYDQQYRADTQFGKVMAAFSGLIIFIACLGLFGLSSYTITQRTKEIGIRKVLGASVSEIVRLLSLNFAKTVIAAALIALPIAYFIMEQWLSNYFVRISLNVWIFVFAVAIILLLAVVTVSFQTVKSAIANPVDSLKQE
ncbi:MAG TPA: ABC transporter permease [Chryseolinea sp.]|nr:ABC transporter permease [Chryseolinea sp.]